MQELKVDHEGLQLNEAQRTLQEVILALGRREGPGSAWHEKNSSVDQWRLDQELPRSQGEVGGAIRTLIWKIRTRHSPSG